MQPLDLTNLPNYTGSAGSGCPKCGHQDPALPHSTSWVAGNTTIYPGGELHGNELPDADPQPGYFLRSCGRCSYGWPERTVDNPAQTGA